ncbi:uncharacterized protein LOC102671781 [Apis dorsata]|uniref:uncharacterized protein LOC102671781 n=1 Tax=Apis dorsata TaxID=7462 RepID=UPI0003DF6B71|nr:uncharacterized protein LOC102671781 [Apis dorsata]
MQSLIPLILALSLASASQLNLLPYAYLSSPIPIYNQYQNTVTGEHAYSYAGGPSAKEEVKDASGVLRGSYSYVDANGVLQSAFYVADDNGFRVAATNIPTDENQNDLETTAHIILARSAVAERSSTPSRRRRSLQDSNPTLPEKNEQKEQSLDGVQNDTNRQTAPSQSPSTSSSLLLQPLLNNNNNIPLATSHQSQVQVHSNARLEAKPVDLHPILPVQTILGGLPVLARTPTYHENRIELHKQLGIEGSRPKDAVKIKPEPLTVVRSVFPLVSTVLESVPVLPTIVKETVSVLPAQLTSMTTTSVSSHGVSQIHGSSNVVAKEGIAVAPTERKEIAHVPVVKGEASVTSYGVSQIHGGEINPIGLLVKTAPAVAEIHPAIHVPVSL